MTSERVPFHRPRLGEAERQAVQRVLDRGWLTTGPENEAFETELATTFAAAAAVCVASGTDALHLAMRVFDLGPGDEVVTSPLAFAASAETILAVGARPVFADVDPVSGNLDPEAAAAAIGPSTRALLGLALGGHPRGLADLASLARHHGLIFGVDAAHGPDIVTAEGPLAAQADFVGLSFYASKNLTSGEGGAILLRDADRAARARRLRVHGMDRASRERDGARRPWDYDVREIGLKANLSDLAAALGRTQLARHPEFVAERRRLARRYRDALADLRILALPEAPPEEAHAWHLYAPRLQGDEPARRKDILLEGLVADGIGVSVHFRPLHLMTAYAHLARGEGSFPRAEEYWARSFSLPLFPGLRDDEQDRVVSSLRRRLAEVTS